MVDSPDPTKPQPLRRFISRAGRDVEIETVGELLYWSYANLAAADVAEANGLERYDTRCWMIRAKLFKGLRMGTMKLGTLFADVREMPSDHCVYCGATPVQRMPGLETLGETAAHILN